MKQRYTSPNSRIFNLRLSQHLAQVSTNGQKLYFNKIERNGDASEAASRRRSSLWTDDSE